MTSILNHQLVDTKKATDILITILIILGAFFVPTFLAKVVPLGQYQQLVIGSIVNMSLILTALFTKGTLKTFAIVTLPSVSTILGGLLFGGMTLYSKTMIPAIWLGNFAFIFLYKFLFLKKNLNYPLTAIISIIIKVSIIYLGFTLMTYTMSVPDLVKETLNISMGLIQLITATCGSILASFIVIYTKHKKSKNS